MKKFSYKICKPLITVILSICLASGAYALPGDEIWSVPTSGNIGSSVVINPVHDLIYVGSANNNVYAYDRAGVYQWRFTTSGYVGSSPTVSDDGGRVFVGSYDGNVYAMDAVTGVELWRFTTAGPVYSSPAYTSAGTVYAGSSDGTLYAIDATTGIEQWHYSIGSNVGASPAVGVDGTVYVGAENGTIYALSGELAPQNRLLWSHVVSSNGVMSAAIESGNRLYVGTFDNTLLALDLAVASPQRIIWTASLSGRIASSPAIGTDGTIFVTSFDNGGLAALDSSDGSFKWRLATGGSIYSSPAVGADGTVFVGSFSHNFYAVNHQGATYSLKWSFRADSEIISSPVIDRDGTVYFVSKSSRLYAMEDDNGGLANSVWPMFGHDSRHSRSLIIAPVANDDIATTTESAPVTIDVLANDTDTPGDELSVAWVTQPANGTAQNNGSDVTYTPSAGYSGNDSFTYTVIDAIGGTDVATVAVTIVAGPLDTDHDGIPDVDDPDDDNDGLTDVEEQLLGTEPLIPDTDGDGDWDGDEVAYGSDPLLASDTLDDHRPATPVLDPVADALPLKALILNGSAFSDPDPADTLGADQWQLALDAGFSDIILDRNRNAQEATDNGATLPVPDGVLAEGGYQVWGRVRHSDNRGLWSNWSITGQYQTPVTDTEDTDADGRPDSHQFDGNSDLDQDSNDDAAQGMWRIYNNSRTRLMGLTLQQTAPTGAAVTSMAPIATADIPVGERPSGPMPYGLMRYSISLPQGSSTAASPAVITIGMHFDEEMPAIPAGTTWIRYDQATRQAIDVTADVTVSGSSASVYLDITDGGAGDHDGAVNDRIVGLIGPVFPSQDSDSDGIMDHLDNCTQTANPNQIDTDGDGFGNYCDPDYNNDGSINFIDLGIMKSVFFGDDANVDLNGDGSINFIDLGIMKSMFFGSPGPSGLVP